MKRLALLLLSCLACTGTITSPEAGYWATGEERELELHLSNAGPDPWTAGATPMFVEVDGRRVEVALDRDVAVGETVTASLRARAPLGIGLYTLSIGAGSVALAQQSIVTGCSVGGAYLLRGPGAAGELDTILSSGATAEETISAAATAANGYDISVYSDPARAEAVIGAMAGYGQFGQALADMIGTLVTDHGLNVFFTDAPYNAFLDAATYGVDAVVVSTTAINGAPLSNEYMSQTLAHEATHAAQSMAPEAAPFATTPAPDAAAFAAQSLQVEAEAEAAAIGLANEQGMGTGFASQQTFNDAYNNAVALGYSQAEAHGIATAALAAALEAGALTLADPAADPGAPGTPDGTGDPDGSDGTGGDGTGGDGTGGDGTGGDGTGGDSGGGDSGGGDSGGGDSGGGE